MAFQITDLKIDNNPFAKGFRDSGAGKREKKRLASHRLGSGGHGNGLSSASCSAQVARILGGDHSADESDDDGDGPSRAKRARSSESASSASTAEPAPADRRIGGTVVGTRLGPAAGTTLPNVGVSNV